MQGVTTVGIIGAGPGGLVAARWLAAQGMQPVVFEQSAALGGQWSALPGRSGVWPAMHTNTSWILTAFGDLEHRDAVVFPSAGDVHGYLNRYADAFDLRKLIHFGTRVRLVDRAGARWRLVHDGGVDYVDRVVVAPGRFHRAVIPEVAGLDGFTGSAGVTTTYDYRGAEPYRGKRMLVAGCAVSALEIAADLAHAGAEHVTVTQRRQRYVLPKFAAGVPSDHRFFTRYATLAGESLPSAEVERQLKEIVTAAGGSPEQYGAPAPDPSLAVAGVTLSQDYLPLVAEGRISVRPWLTSVAGSSVTYADGRTEHVDGMVFGTGYRLDLPFLGDEVRSAVGLDDVHLDVDRHTFHPDLPGLAFVGMWDQSGGYFVPLELQARWIAYVWGGRLPPLDAETMRASVAACRARRGTPQKTRMNVAALTFARAAGVEPRLDEWPDLHRALLFGPLSPASFRLVGADALPDAAARVRRDAATFGAITSPVMTRREVDQWSLLKEAMAGR